MEISWQFAFFGLKSRFTKLQNCFRRFFRSYQKWHVFLVVEICQIWKFPIFYGSFYLMELEIHVEGVMRNEELRFWIYIVFLLWIYEFLYELMLENDWKDHCWRMMKLIKNVFNHFFIIDVKPAICWNDNFIYDPSTIA